MSRSALETVKIYIDEVWNGGRDELVPELCADPVTRHDANSLTQLDHAEQRARIAHNFAELRPRFENVIFSGDEEFVTLVWNVTGRDPAWKLCGIEVFRVVGGRITEVWNSPYVDGRWGLSRTLSGNGRSFPIMSAAFGADGGEIVAPVDARNIGRWLERLLGAPASVERDGGWEHRFAGTGDDRPLSLTLSEIGEGSRTIADASVDRLTIEVARSGLVNAAIAVSGTARSGQAGPAAPAGPVTRLAETFGELEGAGRVVDGSIAFGPGGAGASGRVSIRMAEPRQPGGGRLTIGWRHEGYSLRFEMEAQLSGPTNSFADGGETEASFDWRAEGVVAILDNDVPGA